MIFGLVFLEHTKWNSSKQREYIESFAKKHELKIDKFISYNENPNLLEVKEHDTVIMYSWSCICKTRTNVNKFLGYFIRNKVYLYSVTSKNCIDNTFDFEQLSRAFSLIEDVHSTFLSNKNYEVARTRVSNGKEPGRHRGSVNKKHVLDGRETEILAMYADGKSMYSIAKKMRVSAPTIKRFLTIYNTNHKKGKV